MKSRVSALALVALAACNASAGLEQLPPAGAGMAQTRGGAVADGSAIVGGPYEVNGVTYTPSNPARYDEVGLASWYGAELAGRPTANGERFDPAGISAAHRTLPLPSYVEVTALGTGRTILVRINDRGPFHPDRIIDLSVGATEQLGIAGQGSTPVRVRLVQPGEADRAALRSGRPAGERLAASPQLLNALRERLARGGGAIAAAQPSSDASMAGVRDAPVPAAVNEGPGVSWEQPAASIPSPPPRAAPTPVSGNGYFVQLGAFSSAANADRLAARARSLGPVDIAAAGGLRRVRLGPYASSAEAQRALASARAAGYGDARIFRD